MSLGNMLNVVPTISREGIRKSHYSLSGRVFRLVRQKISNRTRKSKIPTLDSEH